MGGRDTRRAYEDDRRTEHAQPMHSDAAQFVGDALGHTSGRREVLHVIGYLRFMVKVGIVPEVRESTRCA